MENQHRKIKGYKEPTQEQIDLMNTIKRKGVELHRLVITLRSYDGSRDDTELKLDQRWVSEGVTDLQKGLMSLTRAIAKPDFF